jgi:predicted O-linked N-acetylglucosamine transferase (SPINDLY family)
MTSKRDEAFAAHRQGNLPGAERLYNELLRATPSDPEFRHHFGLLCYQLGRRSESVQHLRAALAFAPGSLPTMRLLIHVLQENGEVEGALRTLDDYLMRQPQDAEMLCRQGQLLGQLGRFQQAETVFLRAATKSSDPAIFHYLGLCRQRQGNLLAAADAYEEAIRRGHEDPQTRLWMAQCLRAAGRVKEYYEAATGSPKSLTARLDLLLEAQSARRYVCDWDGYERDLPELLAGLKRQIDSGDARDFAPGLLNLLDIDEELIANFARRYATHLSEGGRNLRAKLHNPRATRTDGRIRLGYLSTDFYAHAVGYLVRDLFAAHDRMRFEVFGYSLRHRSDEVHAAIRKGCNVFRDLAGRNAESVAQTILDDRIDILIDLAGYTSAARPLALAVRPAPVQVSWLGYLGTSGASFIDYIIADDVVLPPEIAGHYSENVIRLPCFMVASPHEASDRRFRREELGLKRDAFVFCSFNQPYKLDRETFAAWMEILRGTSDSQLWLYAPDTSVCAENLRREASRSGVGQERLVFAGPEPMANHIARMAVADLALDPFHISGGATTAAALAAGLPVLTLQGGSFLARMGSSINAFLRMEDLDCLDREQYVKTAIDLANSAGGSVALKAQLGAALQATGFFDPARFVTALENVLQIAWDRHASGLAPADIRFRG